MNAMLWRGPVLDDWEMRSTPKMAAMRMLMPSADSKARTRRLRSPRLATRSRSRPDSRDPPVLVSRADWRVTEDPSVADLDAPAGGRGDVAVVGDDPDGGAVAVQLPEPFQA